mmetsp:Transcript_775/g.1288  ORF Transcript_775/g.1288 Transcript_775/m.1288 type:complete len:236 (+) Transcript_775:1706-2413(+)
MTTSNPTKMIADSIKIVDGFLPVIPVRNHFSKVKVIQRKVNMSIQFMPTVGGSRKVKSFQMNEKDRWCPVQVNLLPCLNVFLTSVAIPHIIFSELLNFPILSDTIHKCHIRISWLHLFLFLLFRQKLFLGKGIIKIDIVLYSSRQIHDENTILLKFEFIHHKLLLFFVGWFGQDRTPIHIGTVTFSHRSNRSDLRIIRVGFWFNSQGSLPHECCQRSHACEGRTFFRRHVGSITI